MSRMEGYSISPSLIILLKFVDGHLSLPSTYSSPLPSTLVSFILERLEELSRVVLQEQGRGRDAADAQVFQGVVLVLHCMVEIGLGVEAEKSRRENLGEKGDEEWQEEGLRDEKGVETVIRESTAAKDRDFVRLTKIRELHCVGLLGFSRNSIPSPSPRPPPLSPSTPKIVELPSSSSPEDSSNIPAYQLLKLTCVKYLGIISFASPTRPIAPLAQEQLEKTQNLIREKGGLGLLLGMCQIDGTNPSKQPTYFSSLLFELDEGGADENRWEGVRSVERTRFVRD